MKQGDDDDDLRALAVAPGDEISAAWAMGVLAAIERRTLRPGKDVRTLNLPDCTIVRSRGRGGSGGGVPANLAFQVAMAVMADGSPAVTVSKGLIAGYEPEIDGLKISTVNPVTSEFPKFKIDPASAIDPTTGIGLLYAQVFLNFDYSISKIGLLAIAKPPPETAWSGFKLLAYLRRDPASDRTAPITPLQAVWFNLGHTTSQRFGGKARHTFWAT